MAQLYICDICGAQCNITQDGKGTIVPNFYIPYYNKEGDMAVKKQDVCTGCLRRIIQALDREKYTVVEWSQVKRPYTRNTKKSAATQEDNE